MEIDRSNVVKRVITESPAAVAGLRPGDVIDTIEDFRVRTFADATFALDKAPKRGSIDVKFRRGNRALTTGIKVKDGWKRTDLSWRPSMQHLLASPRMFGADLSSNERIKFGLTPQQLAFRHRDRVLKQARLAGIQSGDVILGFDGEVLEMDAYEFQTYVRRRYLIGETVTVNIIRDGQRKNLKMKFID